MSITSAASELREAAKLMRDRAYDVPRHEDRWGYQERFDSPSYEGHIYCEGDPQRSGMADVILGSEAGQHIASWSPAVALAVADWLDDTAELQSIADLSRDDAPAVGHALAVARAYLGADAEAVSRG